MLLLLLLLSSAVPGFITQSNNDWELAPFLQNGDTLYACAGDSVTFDWRLNPKGSVVNVRKIQFQHHNEADALTSDLDDHDFIAFISISDSKPERVLIPQDEKYAGRIEVDRRVMTIRRLQVADSGLYSMVVEGRDRATGAKKRVTSTVTLVVADDIMTTDKRIHISESAHALFDQTTGRHHKVLECGNFTYKTMPPFDVAWKVPGSNLTRSTEYRVSDGRFRLVLPLRMRTGSYSCSVTKDNAVRACAKQLVQDKISLDATETRFWLLGKDLARTQTKVKVNNATFAKGRATNAAKISSLSQQLTSLENSVDVKNAQLTAKDVQLASKDVQLASKDVQLASKSAQLDNLIAQLNNTDAQLKANLTDLRKTLYNPCERFQYTTISNPERAVSNYKASRRDCDSHLFGWHRFFLNGKDATIPTSCVRWLSCGTNVGIWLDLENKGMPGLGQERQVTGCGSSNYKQPFNPNDASCCSPKYTTSVTIRNCNTFFIYHLNGTFVTNQNRQVCSMSYCTEN